MRELSIVEVELISGGITAPTDLGDNGATGTKDNRWVWAVVGMVTISYMVAESIGSVVYYAVWGGMAYGGHCT